DMRTNRDLTDSQWAVLDPLIPEPSRRKDGRGRPWRARRPVLDGILWVLRNRRTVGRSTRAVSFLPDLPPPFPAMGSLRYHARCAGGSGRRPAQPWWIRSGRSLHRRQFRSCKKGGPGVGKTKRGKGTKIMAVADRNGLPITVCTESATPHEVKL